MTVTNVSILITLNKENDTQIYINLLTKELKALVKVYVLRASIMSKLIKYILVITL